MYLPTVVIGFQETQFSVDEEDGSVNLIVSVISGAIPTGSTVTVTVSTIHGSATSQYRYTRLFFQLFHAL